MTQAQPFFGGSHLTIAVHAGNRKHPAVLDVVSKEIALAYVTLIDDLVPGNRMAYVKQSGVELPCPENGTPS
jgi:hypothetical protein